ncbi:glycosyltransferase [Acidianus sulfidivorans JP7]|uniref:Glycosyltransferase family 2 protein n=1 Tax=Acidianus sulfidivorans JP7 TaxID=619593 RepID=A0A2U9IN32_9CREN|nr:glycosyltransferase family A protein [Acidianus sulfidivorans]AWR97420.1 glycosyltransferase [Acidianus sulfidivorans JP7]
MTIKVFIPTVGRPTLQQSINALREQTFKDLEIILIVKNNNFIINNVHIIVQKEGYFEEAINLALKNINGDEELILFTDDDAIPSKSWVEDHLEFHCKNKNIAIASGKILGKKWKNYPNALFKKYKNTEFMKPYSNIFSEYIGFLTKVGLSVDRENIEEKEIQKSLAIAGVNMSLKPEIFKNKQIPEFTLRGSYNETILALYSIKEGYSAAVFDGALVNHLGEESLSRTNNSKIEKYLMLEKHTLPYGVNYIFPIDEKLLENFLENVTEKIPKIGLELALRGIKEKICPHEFRKLLQKEMYELDKF